MATKFTRYGRCGDVDGARPVTAVMGRLRHFGGRIVLLGEKLYLLSFGVLLLGSQACDEFLKSRGWCGFRQDHPEFGVSWGCSGTPWIRWFRWSAGKQAHGVCLLKLKVPQGRSLSAYAWSPNVCTRICAIWSQYLASQQFGACKGTMMWMGEVARARSLGKHV